MKLNSVFDVTSQIPTSTHEQDLMCRYDNLTHIIPEVNCQRSSPESGLILVIMAGLAVLSMLSICWHCDSAKIRLDETLEPASAKSCPLCGFVPLRNTTSTKRDVVLAAALTSMKRVEYFLRTLRTTGTQARVILFLSSQKTISEQWRRFFTACNIEPVFVTETSTVLTESPKLSRYYYYHQWLTRHVNEVDRVLHTDTFDVIFQSDPFIPEIRKDRLYFTLEPVKLSGSRWTSMWLEQCYGVDFLHNYSNRIVSCSGVTAGGGALFLKYLNLMLNSPDWIKCFGHSLDQAHHNYLWYTGEFAKAGIEIEGWDCNSPFLTMHFCCKIGKCLLDENDVMFGNSSRAPVLLHQYNRWRNLTKRNEVLCPNSKRLFEMTAEFEIAPLETLPPLDFVLPNETKLP